MEGVLIMENIALAKAIENLSDFTSVNQLAKMIGKLDKETKESLEDVFSKLTKQRNSTMRV